MFIEIALNDQSKSSKYASEDRNQAVAASKVQGSLCIALLGV
jgi:hypothetical protein